MQHPRFSIVCSLLLLALLFLASCVSNVCLPPVGTPSLTPSVVSTTGDHVGKSIQWGGILIETPSSQGAYRARADRLPIG